MNDILKIETMSISFGGLVALSNLSLSLDEGEIRSLIGPNGSGKTTVFNIVTGLYKADRGSVLFDNEDITKLTADKIVKKGIARTFQNIELFPQMTVLENVIVGCHAHIKMNLLGETIRSKRVKREEEKAMEEGRRVLKLLGLERYEDWKAVNMPFGQQRLVELGRALATKPKMLLLDEPCAGMTLFEAENLGNVLRNLREKGLTVFVVEHTMDFVMRISDRVSVLVSGSKIAEGKPEEVQNNPKVIQSYLGDGTDVKS